MTKTVTIRLLLGSALALSCIGTGRAQEKDDASTAIITRLPAPEAGQGVATDAGFIYAINNSTIGKYDRRTGRRVAVWQGDPVVFPHINSCQVHDRKLACAMSNFPAAPMTSSVEWFDTATMRHIGSHSFGPGRGSLTWIDWHDGNWWACFANYDVEGSDGGRDHRASVLVRMTPDFTMTESWLFPTEVLERVKPFSLSGGRWGRDGHLYVTGHSRPEMYVLSLPEGGGRLHYIRTIAMATDGQAFDWDSTTPSHLWSVQRSTHEVVESRLP